jgi:hypothetical protein
MKDEPNSFAQFISGATHSIQLSASMDVAATTKSNKQTTQQPRSLVQLNSISQSNALGLLQSHEECNHWQANMSEGLT